MRWLRRVRDAMDPLNRRPGDPPLSSQIHLLNRFRRRMAPILFRHLEHPRRIKIISLDESFEFLPQQHGTDVSGPHEHSRND